MSDTKGPNNFSREGEHNMVTREHVEQLQSERPDHVEELHYTIGGRIEAAIRSNLNAEREHAIATGERVLHESPERVETDLAIAANEGRARTDFERER